MLREYVRGAMHQAYYELLEDDGTYYGEIPEFEGGLRERGDAGAMPGGT